MNDLEKLTDQLTAVAQTRWVWRNGTLPFDVRSYITNICPPKEYIVSVRCLVTQDDSVLVVRTQDDETHVLPGGHIELDESFEDAIRRELMEETGWSVSDLSYEGFICLTRLVPKPKEIQAPHPHFCHLIYSAQAKAHDASIKLDDDYEQSSDFIRYNAVIEMLDDPINLSFLKSVWEA